MFMDKKIWNYFLGMMRITSQYPHFSTNQYFVKIQGIIDLLKIIIINKKEKNGK